MSSATDKIFKDSQRMLNVLKNKIYEQTYISQALQFRKMQLMLLEVLQRAKAIEKFTSIKHLVFGSINKIINLNYG